MRPPRAAPLRPFVECLWVGQRPAGGEREHVLPAADMHLAIRIAGGPVQLYDDAVAPAPVQTDMALLAGARTSAYWKDASVATRSVGVQLRPGAARALFGVSAQALQGAHVPLEALWGSESRRLHEALHEATGAEAQMALLERALLSRLRDDACARTLHPAVAMLLARIGQEPAMARLPDVRGISQRHLIACFRDATGLSPKRYARVRRFQGLVAMLEAQPARPLVELALAAGYSDQPHCNREFRALTGTTPQAWRSRRRGLSVDAGGGAGQFRSRPGPRD